MKKIIIGMLTAVAMLFVGCDKISNAINSVDASTYAQLAGKAVATIVVTSDKYFTDETKAQFKTTLDEVITKLPKDVSSSNLVATATKIVNEKLTATVKDETKRSTYIAALDVVYGVIGQALSAFEAKYPTEFKNADTAYALVTSFLTSAKTVFDAKLVAADNSAEYKAVYEEILKAVIPPTKK